MVCALTFEVFLYNQITIVTGLFILQNKAVVIFFLKFFPFSKSWYSCSSTRECAITWPWFNNRTKDKEVPRMAFLWQQCLCSRQLVPLVVVHCKFSLFQLGAEVILLYIWCFLLLNYYTKNTTDFAFHIVSRLLQMNFE